MMEPTFVAEGEHIHPLYVPAATEARPWERS